MKILLILTPFVFLAHVVHAAPSPSIGYDLQMKVSIDGSEPLTSQMLVKKGQATLMKQKRNGEQTFIEVIADDGAIHGAQGIVIKFKIGTIDVNQKRHVSSEPEILVQENKAAKITMNGRSGKTSLEVTAKRKIL